MSLPWTANFQEVADSVGRTAIGVSGVGGEGDGLEGTNREGIQVTSSGRVVGAVRRKRAGSGVAERLAEVTIFTGHLSGIDSFFLLRRLDPHGAGSGTEAGIDGWRDNPLAWVPVDQTALEVQRDKVGEEQKAVEQTALEVQRDKVGEDQKAVEQTALEVQRDKVGEDQKAVEQTALEVQRDKVGEEQKVVEQTALEVQRDKFGEEQKAVEQTALEVQRDGVGEEQKGMKSLGAGSLGLTFVPADECRL
ncbi:hypothetical protein SKAU_G00131500 [Synaphobranchus kaupii]|uniref:Uncharacterized protein n=1 Tax=Synaphobranchus kaupii TaxID=118154 RepID=A0A9Q1FQW7_SYNKA|nr:hypothetical protein SKAU_G00131500 [Synaphobranchus kaupii]